MKFGYVVQNSIAHTSTVGNFEIIFLEREKESHEDSTSGGFNLFSVSLTFGNSIGAVGGITEGISGNRYRCRKTRVRLEVRDELFTIGN